MNLLANQSYLLNQQYQNGSNLDARIQLHLRFSTNFYGWHRWLFDQLNLRPNARILELGCGTAKLWTENLERIPPGWEITLSDFSAGILAQAEQNLSAAGQAFRFEQVDAQSIPFDNGSFDAVFANHMLHHVPDLPRAFGEIRRVLKPGGQLYASSNGAEHLCELDNLIREFDSSIEFVEQADLKFTLENGQEQLATFFEQISLARYPDSLLVTEATPLVAFIFSMIRISLDEHELMARFSQYINEIMQKNGGQFCIRKDPGLFIAR